MNTDILAATARETIEEHDLIGWTFKWSRAKNTAGTCNYRTKTISLSKPLMEEWSESAALNTLLHEIAHAMVGPGNGHNRKWQRQARAIGNTGDRCWTPSDDAPEIAPQWIAVCPNGHVSPRGYHRRPTATRSCGICRPRVFDARYVFDYVKMA